MYETMDACNIEPLLQIESRQKPDVSMFSKNSYENTLYLAFSGKKVSSAVKSDNEPQLITSEQPPGFPTCELQNYHDNSYSPISTKSFNTAPFQYQTGTSKQIINPSITRFHNNSEYIYLPPQNNCYNDDIQNYNGNNYSFNEGLNCNNLTSSSFKTDNIFNNNVDEEDEFESVINPRSRQALPSERDSNLPSSPCPLYINPFTLSTQSDPYTNPHIQSESTVATMMFPTFSLDLFNSYGYLSQDTDDAFASVIYSTPPQLKPVLCPSTQTQSTLSQFYSDSNSIYNNNFNCGFKSCCGADVAKQNNLQNQTFPFTPFFSTDQENNYLHQIIHYENSQDDQNQPQNKNSLSGSQKHRQRISSNEYKRYKSPAFLIVQPSSPSDITNGPDSQPIPTKNSGTSLSVSSERRARTRKVSSSPSLGKPSRTNFSNSTDIDIDNKKPVINFQKPTISSSNNEKINNQAENKRCETIARSKIRGRR